MNKGNGKNSYNEIEANSERKRDKKVKSKKHSTVRIERID
jgi:hypothetical protein